MSQDSWMDTIARLAADPPFQVEGASTCQKSRLYSRLIEEASREGPLAPLADTRDAGFGLCVFEHLVAIAPSPAKVQEFQYCRVCHARVLGERVENAPIFWPNCPYSEFQK